MIHLYEAVIGLECHAQLLTKSKLFCSCSTKFGDAPNGNTCPVCLGLPGALPVFNRVALMMAVRAALGLNCKINIESQWARKNYFYPDLPKGYQISQYDRPLAQHGFIETKVDGKRKKVGVQRVHMEEDAGKSLHEGLPDSNRSSYLDFNRSGVPLIEIVSDPDIRSSAEAYDYLARLKQVLEYLSVCDGNMEEGSLRCDANVSVRRIGEQKFGTRTELKNINSFRFVQKAIDYEVNRQIEVIESGGRIFEETAKLCGQAKTAANWIMGDLLRFYNDNNVDLKDLSDSPLTPTMLASMISLVDKGTISGKIAKTVMEEMYQSGKDPQQIIEE